MGLKTPKGRPCVKNEHVFALRVTLLKIAHGSKLLSHFIPAIDLKYKEQQESMTEYFIATRLADRIINLESKNYANVVLRCIQCNFDSVSFEFEDEKFRDKFVEGVVMPLQEDWEFITGNKL